MYKGTLEGNIYEIQFVKTFNSNKQQFTNYLNNFSQTNNLWMIRVTSNQFSKLSNKKVFTRADCYLAKINANINNLLIQNSYYLSEEILDDNKIIYEKIPFSGISIKMTTSENFQILKLTPHSFKMLFDSYELGAGASLFCMKKNELEKNPNLITGWNSSISAMTEYFFEYTKGNNLFYLNEEICKQIKIYSCQKIKNIVENSIELQRKIFNGIGLYEEPYTALYFYHGNDLLPLTTIPFNVTTGSGRSKGDYTLVFKPK